MSYKVALATFLDEVDAEVNRARHKFPKPDYLVTALAEEAGEAVRAAMETLYSTGTSVNKGEREKLRKELVQTMAMCIRLEMEGDPIHKVKGHLE